MPNYRSTLCENLLRWLTIRLAQCPHIVVASLMFFFAAGAQGNAFEFKDQDTLPQPENIVFAKQYVGIISKDDRYFVLERKTDRLQQVDAETFARQFPSPWPPKPYELLQTKNVLRSSSGQEFEQKSAYCDEGVQEANKLHYRQRPFPDVLKPCMSVAALEVIGNHVWLGTIRPGESGPGPGEGIVVQLLDKKQKIRTITVKSGLTGSQIRMLRDDPFTKTVWVATEWGLNQIDRPFKVIWGRYWYEDFEASSQKGQTFLSVSRKASNPFSVFGRELGVQDWSVFSQAIKRISPAEKSTIRLYDFHTSGFRPRSLSSGFTELVPFFIEGAQSATPMVHAFGLSNLCKFDDPRVRTFMTTLASKTIAQSADEIWVQECLKAWSTQAP